MAGYFHVHNHPGVLKIVNMNGNILQRYFSLTPHFKFLLSKERLDFLEFLKSKIKRINNANKFSQVSLIIFTKGADIFDHDYI